MILAFLSPEPLFRLLDREQVVLENHLVRCVLET